MKVIHKLILCAGFALLVTACGRGDSFEIAPGSEVHIEKQDGVEVRGTLVEVGPEQVVVDTGGVRTRVARSEIRTIAAAPPAPQAGGRDERRRDVVGTSGTDSAEDPASRAARSRASSTPAPSTAR